MAVIGTLGQRGGAEEVCLTPLCGWAGSSGPDGVHGCDRGVEIVVAQPAVFGEGGELAIPGEERETEDLLAAVELADVAAGGNVERRHDAVGRGEQGAAVRRPGKRVNGLGIRIIVGVKIAKGCAAGGVEELDVYGAADAGVFFGQISDGDELMVWGERREPAA